MADGSTTITPEMGLTQKDLGIAKVEQTPNYREMVDNSVDKYTRVFGIAPQDAERVRGIEVIEGYGERFREEYNAKKQEYLGELAESKKLHAGIEDSQRRAQIDARIERLITVTEREEAEHRSLAGGSYLYRDDGREMIFVPDRVSSNFSLQDRIDHEVLHALGFRGSDKGTGFDPSPREDGLVDFKTTKLNEAVIEFLRFAANNEGRPANQLCIDIHSAIHKAKYVSHTALPYQKDLQLLAFLIQDSYGEGKPITVQDLVEYNLKSKDKSAKQAAEEFRNHLIESTGNYRLLDRLTPMLA